MSWAASLPGDVVHLQAQQPQIAAHFGDRAAEQGEVWLCWWYGLVSHGSRSFSVLVRAASECRQLRCLPAARVFPQRHELLHMRSPRRKLDAP